MMEEKEYLLDKEDRKIDTVNPPAPGVQEFYGKRRRIAKFKRITH